MEAAYVTKRLPEAVADALLLLQLRINVELVLVLGLSSDTLPDLLLGACLGKRKVAPEISQWIERIDD